MATDKIQTMLHFAIRAGKTVFGTDQIVLSRKKKVIVFCSTLSENSTKKMLKDNPNTPIIRSILPLEQILSRSGKAIAVTDSNMADQILKNINDNYELVSEGK